jgi:E3 ubiquitin-protein ligase DCST1
VPTLATGEGRLAFVVIAVGALLAGPVSNIYVNMEEVSRAMGCSAEQSYNQTMFLLQPFDAMMTQLNWTIGGLQDAATNIGRGLKPLEDGLGTVEMYLENGKLQLYGTRKVR